MKDISELQIEFYPDKNYPLANWHIFTKMGDGWIPEIISMFIVKERWN